MTKTDKVTSRRTFTKQLALIASTPILTTFCTASEVPSTETPEAQAAKQLIAKAAKGLTELVRVRYGQNINNQDWRFIEASVAKNLSIAEKLRQTKLKNSDEPATIFRA